MKRIIWFIAIISSISVFNYINKEGILVKNTNRDTINSSDVENKIMEPVVSSNEHSMVREESYSEVESGIDTAPIVNYLKDNIYGGARVSLVSYDGVGTIRLRASYSNNAMHIHLPRHIMVDVKEIEDMGYPIDSLEVEFYVQSGRWNSSEESVLLYRNSNLDGINIYDDELGYVRSESFYRGSEIEILNKDLFEDNEDLKILYGFYEENR